MFAVLYWHSLDFISQVIKLVSKDFSYERQEKSFLIMNRLIEEIYRLTRTHTDSRTSMIDLKIVKSILFHAF